MKLLLVAFISAAAYALPGNLVVSADQYVPPDETAGLYYLGPAGDEYFYNGDAGALSRLGEYRVLDAGARAKDYYVVWKPAGPADAAAYGAYGTAVALGDNEVLVGLPAGADPKSLREADVAVEIRYVSPVVPVPWTRDAEPPPTRKSRAVADAVSAITAGEYAGYILQLQNFITRANGTAGNVAARDYIYGFFQNLGITASLFPFEWLEYRGFNVVAESVGSSKPDEIIIICGHFDSYTPARERAPGADDNASGVACVLAAARALNGFTFERTVRYVAFDAEEWGCLGSVAYASYCARQGENVIAVLNADMVAYDEENGRRDDFSARTRTRWLGIYLKTVGGLYGESLIYDTATGAVSDDYYFHAYGYPAVGLIEGDIGEGGIACYPYIHTPSDTLDKLTPSLAVRFCRDYAATLAHLAGFNETGIHDANVAAPAKPKARAFGVYPNPYVHARGGAVNFVGVASPATATVYDLAGRRVATWAVPAGDACAWQPAGADGAPLAPGVYFYRVDGADQAEVGKLMITE